MVLCRLASFAFVLTTAACSSGSSGTAERGMVAESIPLPPIAPKSAGREVEPLDLEALCGYSVRDRAAGPDEKRYGIEPTGVLLINDPASFKLRPDGHLVHESTGLSCPADLPGSVERISTSESEGENIMLSCGYADDLKINTASLQWVCMPGLDEPQVVSTIGQVKRMQRREKLVMDPESASACRAAFDRSLGETGRGTLSIHRREDNARVFYAQRLGGDRFLTMGYMGEFDPDLTVAPLCGELGAVVKIATDSLKYR